MTFNGDTTFTSNTAVANGGALWIQGLYNYLKQESNSKIDGFTGKTAGFSIGVDGELGDDFVLGLGYGYTYTDVDSDGRSTNIDGNNFFIYGQYKPGNWYINETFIYGISKYNEKKRPAGVLLESKYDVTSFGFNLMSGYNFNNGITPEFGIRYLMTDQDSYNDGVQTIKSDASNLVTGVAALKYSKDIASGSRYYIKPNIRLALMYDILSDDSESMIYMSNGSFYQVTGERLNRLSAEASIGLNTKFDDFETNIEFSGNFRENYRSYNTLLKVKYHFNF